MYETFFTFFGLRENPFSGSLDPRYSFVTPRFQKTIDDLLSSIGRGNTFALLTGEIGTGKTFLIRRLLLSLQERAIPAGFIFYTQLDGNHLFDLVLADFGIRCESRLKSDALQCLRDWLLSRPPEGRTPVLLVDEAQGLSGHAFREIQMLLNLETPQQKLLQIVLAGEPNLEDTLARVEFRKLRQRITCRCATEPFTTDETRSYIQTRLAVAGAQDDSIFVPGAIDLIDAYSRGIPRVINLLCEQALIRAFSEKFREIPAAIIQDAAHDFHLEAEALRPRYSVAAASAGAGALLAGPPPQPLLASALDPALSPAPADSLEELTEEHPAAAASATEVPREPPRVIVLPKPNRHDFLSASERRMFTEFLNDLAGTQIKPPAPPPPPPPPVAAKLEPTLESKFEPKPFVMNDRSEPVNTHSQPARPPQNAAAHARSKPRRSTARRSHPHPLGAAAWLDLGRVLLSLNDPAFWRKRLEPWLEWLQHPVYPSILRLRHWRGILR